MIARESGVQQMVVDGNDALVFYRPMDNTDGSMAIVCPEDDVFSGYNRLLYIVWITAFIGLLVIMIFCFQTIRGAITPLHLLAHQAHDIAEGHYSSRLPKTTRGDTIGQLQNSFVDMQQSLSDYVDDINRLNTQMEQRNQELHAANEKALEADRKKTAFLQDMMHQIRTPLNIIVGFSQVLNDNFHELPEEESANIIQMIGKYTALASEPMRNAAMMPISRPMVMGSSMSCSSAMYSAVPSRIKALTQPS